ncbi:hypothetical protein [Vibrio campbellii]|uniref:Uncharacterized protein n=1 Tax=Vibrio campbellii (strain ATCC BAA-1116) TaxID=2902295 RepID=A7MZX7_VIBC1|nr:hypothetical protein [Vibrio campbellii]ABU71960.1 hypothetical protein VIBHAR_03009 [Vibrio campbellii ATCC BAA-1116]AGU96903.1 hypothetical protein M892_15975 [Vibrio campbellii ATCC BAA-1116]MBT0124267.1 hypothetical protein [Vibrio campbellii]MBT0139210.1 hypothetical protein [Vibrio campbellii]MBT0143843.1 hypothetical protein [Vibrio campbellii]
MNKVVSRKINKVLEVPEERIQMLDSQLASIDSDIAVSLSFVRRAQGLTFSDLEQRTSGLKGSTLKRYMQQSYHSMRPIHVVAALSWVMMVPMTSFYYALKVGEYYRGMDKNAIKVLYCIGRLPTEQFELYLQIVANLMTQEAKEQFQQYHSQLLSTIDLPNSYEELLPPSVLDVNEFAIDYYRSAAITVKRFRLENNISIELMARVLGLSDYQYMVLEDVNKVRDFSVAIGFRVKLGLHLDSHASFTSEMQQFPQFHQLRQFQHVRDSLVVEALRQLTPKHKQNAVQILTSLSRNYT